jgi:hypothetical protein
VCVCVFEWRRRRRKEGEEEEEEEEGGGKEEEVVRAGRRRKWLERGGCEVLERLRVGSRSTVW